VENVRSQCRRLQDGRVVYVAEMLVVIQYSVLVVTSGYTRTCKEIVQKDCQARNLNKEDAVDCGRWKKLMKVG